MRKIRFGILLLALSAVFGTAVFAKTYRTEIVPTETIEFTLEDKDKLSIDVIIEEDGIFGVNLTSLSSESSAAPKISITLSNGSKEIYRMETKKPVFAGDDFDVKKFRFAAGLTVGEYKLEIENLTKFSSVTFTAETSFFEEENIESIGNSTFEGATEMYIGEKYHGAVSMLDDIDYYTFEMPYDGYAYIQMYTAEPKYFSLYDENKNEIGYIGIAVEDEDKVYELRSGLSEGRYYIAVETDDDFTAPLYTIKVTASKGEYFETEYNNQMEFANPVLNGKEYYGNLFGVDDEDIFSFTLEKNGGVTVDFTDTVVSKDGHYSVTLSDGENVLFFSDECGRETVSLNLEKGTYYFTVSSLGIENFTNMAYKFKVTSDVPLAVCPPEENDSGSDENEPVEEENVLPFADVYESDWYYDELLEAKGLGLIEGVGDNRYNPKGNVTLAEVIAMAARVRNTTGGANTPLEASPVGKWYNSYITFAVTTGIIKRDDFDNFERSATRAEVAYIFSNLFDDIEMSNNTIIPDVDEDTEYCDSIHKLYALGILKGDDEKGTFYPERNLSRAEAAIILLRIHKA